MLPLKKRECPYGSLSGSSTSGGIKFSLGRESSVVSKNDFSAKEEMKGGFIRKIIPLRQGLCYEGKRTQKPQSLRREKKEKKTHKKKKTTTSHRGGLSYQKGHRKGSTVLIDQAEGFSIENP